MMADRPTWTYDGSVSWQDYIKGAEQVRADAIRDHGIVIQILPNEGKAPYADPWYIQGQGRYSIHGGPGVTFAPQGKRFPRFTIQSATPQHPPVGIIEVYDLVVPERLSITRGHARVVRCRFTGLLSDGSYTGAVGTGGDSRIFGSKHRGGEEKFIWLQDVEVDNSASHNAYIEGTIVVAERVRGHSAKGGYDAFRCIADTFVGRGLELTSTIPYPNPDPTRSSSYLFGGISTQNAYFEDCVFRRTAPQRKSAPYMVGVRCRQGNAGSDQRYVGNAPRPTDVLVPADSRYAYFGPYRQDAQGHYERPAEENPEFYAPWYWDEVRAAGLETPEQVFRNPHMWKQVFRRCRWKNHGPKGVGILFEGTAPVAPPQWGEINPTLDQDDYQRVPDNWIERSHGLIADDCEFVSEEDAADPFVRFVGRDALLHDPRRTDAARVALSGAWDPSRLTMSQAVVVSPDEPWFPQRVDLSRLRHVFPELADSVAETVWRM